MVGDRAGEGAATVPEELAVEQGVRDRPAVERDEGPLGAGAAPMDAAGDELLTGAALAADEDGGRVLRHGVDGLVHFEHRRAATDDGTEALGAMDLGAQPAVLALEVGDVQDLAERHQELVGIAGLHEVVPGAELHGFDGCLGAAVPGQDDHRGCEQAAVAARRYVPLQATQQLHAVHHGHVEVGDHDLERAGAELRQRFLSVDGHLHRVALALEDLRQGACHVGLVLDEQHPSGARGRGGRLAHGAAGSPSVRPEGRSMVKVVPTLGVLRTWMSPR